MTRCRRVERRSQPAFLYDVAADFLNIGPKVFDGNEFRVDGFVEVDGQKPGINVMKLPLIPKFWDTSQPKKLQILVRLSITGNNIAF
jgi:hypothetical protein